MKTHITLIVLCVLIFVLSACAPNTNQAQSHASTDTPTPTVTLTPSPTVEVYAYSKERLFNEIPSYEYFVENPDKVAWAPYDPWTDPENFNKWLYGDLTTDLGDLTQLEFNVQAIEAGNQINAVFEGQVLYGIGPFISQPEIFGVRHNGVEYPVLILKIKGNMDETLGVHAVLLFNGSFGADNGNAEGFNTLTVLNDKKNNVKQIVFFRGNNYFPNLPDEINQLTALGYDAFANQIPLGGDSVETIAFGPGYIKFEKQN